MPAAPVTRKEAQIRRARPDDLDAIVTLTEQAYAQYTQTWDAPPIPVTEDYRPRIADGDVWLLEQEGDLAGLIVLEREPDHIMIFSVAVSPNFQGWGYGRRLLEWAETRARDAGLDEVRLYTNARMERNIALYGAFGYREIGRRPNPSRPGWVLVDMVKSVGVA